MAAWRMEATEVEVEAEVFLVVEGLEEVEVCHICYLLVNLIEVCTSVFFFFWLLSLVIRFYASCCDFFHI